MAREITRETFEKLKSDHSPEATTLLKDYQRAVKCDEMVIVDEPDGTKSVVQLDANGECVTRPMKPK
jgi:hypothetical protein